MSRPGVLVVDGDREDRAFLRLALEGADYAPATFSSGSGALDTLRDTPFDVVIVALESDDASSGLRVAQAVKWRWPGTAVIILAENESFDAVRAALNLGVDGYLVKPVVEIQLRAAVRRVLERQQATDCPGEPAPVLRWRGLALDRQKGDVTLDGEPVHLTPIEFRLLRYLMENGHRVVSPQELFEASHGSPASDPTRADDAIRWHLHNLRQKIEPDPDKPVYILNVYGVGYIFAGP